MTFHIRIGIY